MPAPNLDPTIAADLKKILNIDLPSFWSDYKKQLPRLTGLTEDGKAELAKILKSFDGGLGTLLSKHGRAITDLPGSAAKVQELADKITDVLASYGKKIADKLTGPDLKLAADDFKQTQTLIKTAIAKQAEMIENAKQKKEMLDRKTTKLLASLGTNEEAVKLTNDLTSVVKAMSEKMKKLEKQLNDLDVAQSTEATYNQMGASRGAVVSKAAEAADSAAFAAKAALMFRAKLKQPVTAVETKLKEVKAFYTSEANDWSKKRGSKLGAFYDMQSAIEAAEAFVALAGINDSTLFKYIEGSLLSAKIAKIFADWK